jgi:hypothetical protein
VGARREGLTRAALINDGSSIPQAEIAIRRLLIGSEICSADVVIVRE